MEIVATYLMLSTNSVYYFIMSIPLQNEQNRKREKYCNIVINACEIAYKQYLTDTVDC